MSAILVDQITAVYVVLAVSFAIFAGIFAFVWRLSRQAGLPPGTRGMALGFFVLMWAVFGVLAGIKAISSVGTVLTLSMAALLADWLVLFFCLWKLDKASES